MIRNKIKQYFDANDITIPKAHHATKIARSSFTRLYRNEVVNINLDTIDTICKEFNCCLTDLFEFIPDDQMTKDDFVQIAERKLHVEYYTKLRRKGSKKTAKTEGEE
ncbi:helix-turn-helix domain-containing protein [Neobacillus bataviensis]|uniref:helix-turn-helix domain-containing protein n=1 Tax=Neobacillus bataviensis TaxID=220685 RepID=UPI001CBEF9B7|nr:helix-turn-helix transcriptional regulator [Neobacillus bataviensis]